MQKVLNFHIITNRNLICVDNHNGIDPEAALVKVSLTRETREGYFLKLFYIRGYKPLINAVF